MHRSLDFIRSMLKAPLMFIKSHMHSLKASAFVIGGAMATAVTSIIVYFGVGLGLITLGVPASIAVPIAVILEICTLYYMFKSMEITGYWAYMDILDISPYRSIHPAPCPQ